MTLEDAISGSLKNKELYDIALSKMMLELINYKASERDHKINHNLLTQMVFKYAEAERRLEELNQLKNKFLGIAAHDLRNPLVSVRGFSEVLLAEAVGRLTDEQKEFLTIINKTSDEMLQMVNDLLDVSVIESGKLEISRKSHSLRKILEERIRLLQVGAVKKGINISAEYDDVPEFSFDAGRLGQVIDNLVGNAVKFSPPGSEVKIALAQVNDSVEVVVIDNGPGISAEDSKKLFGTFQKLSASPTGGEKSTGLGLAIVKKIVEAHGGKVWAESEPGFGAKFKFNIPMEDKYNVRS